MVDSSGRFFVEKWDNNHEYIGKDPKSPSKEEISDKLHLKNHLEAYYSLATKHKEALGFK